MNLEAKNGHKVIVTEQSANNGYTVDKEAVKKYLKIGTTYTVKAVKVYSYNTEVFIHEVKDVPFNSVNFEDFE